MLCSVCHGSGLSPGIAISPATGQVISGSTDRTIRYWNIESTPGDQSPSGHKAAVALLTISADGNRAISGTQSGELILWDSSAQEKSDDSIEIDKCKIAPRVIGRLGGHTDRIHSLQMTADGERAVTGSRDRTLRVWDVKRKA